MKPSNIEVISADWIVPIETGEFDSNSGSNDVLSDHAIAIEDDIIIAIAPREQLLADYPNAKHTALAEHILAPGLINAHGHAAMTLMRGMADDYPLMEWLEQHIWPAEADLVSYEFVADGVELAIAEMLLSGTTCFTDMYFFPDATAQVTEKLGMRAQINFPILEAPSPWAENAGQYFEKGFALSDDFRHSPLVKIGFGPHAPYTVSDSSFERVAMLAEEMDLNIHVHLHETPSEIAASIEQYGVTPIERLNQLGVLSYRTQAVHMTQISDSVKDILVNTGTSVIHCPTSNLKLASGYCPVTELLSLGVPVGLGTDGAASNNTLNMFEAVRSAALQAKHISADASALPASQALYMATLGSAKALGIDNNVGSLRVGKQADIIAIDTRCPALQPLHSPISQLVYTDPASAVSHVWIAGKAKVVDRQLIDIDQQALLARCRQWRNRMR